MSSNHEIAVRERMVAGIMTPKVIRDLRLAFGVPAGGVLRQPLQDLLKRHLNRRWIASVLFRHFDRTNEQPESQESDFAALETPVMFEKTSASTDALAADLEPIIRQQIARQNRANAVAPDAGQAAPAVESPSLSRAPLVITTILLIVVLVYVGFLHLIMDHELNEVLRMLNENP